MIRMKIIERTWSEDGAALVRTWYGLGAEMTCINCRDRKRVWTKKWIWYRFDV